MMQNVSPQGVSNNTDWPCVCRTTDISGKMQEMECLLVLQAILTVDFMILIVFNIKIVVRRLVTQDFERITNTEITNLRLIFL